MSLGIVLSIAGNLFALYKVLIIAIGSYGLIAVFSASLGISVLILTIIIYAALKD